MKPAQLKLQPITLGLLEVLDGLELPIIAILSDIGESVIKNPSLIRAPDYKFPKFTLDQIIVTIWCFVTPIDSVEKEINKGIYQAIECARNSILAKYHSEELPIIFSSVVMELVSALAEVGRRLQDPCADDFSI